MSSKEKYVVVSPIFTYWDGNGWVGTVESAKKYSDTTLPKQILGVPFDGVQSYANDYVTYEIEGLRDGISDYRQQHKTVDEGKSRICGQAQKVSR